VPRCRITQLFLRVATRCHASVLGNALRSTVCRQRTDAMQLANMDQPVPALPDEPVPCLEVKNVRALGILYERYWPELCGYLRKTFGIGPPDPQDIAQQTFLRYAAIPGPEDVRNERAYLYRIAHNILMEEHRRLAVRRAAVAGIVSRSLPCADELTPERVLLASERLDVLCEVIRTLPKPRRRSFLLNRIEGLPCAEIARRTGYSESAVKKHVNLVMADFEAAIRRLEGRETTSTPRSKCPPGALRGRSTAPPAPSTANHCGDSQRL
jgi:RNA polymerase sigma factor (sigma-70 family)